MWATPTRNPKGGGQESTDWKTSKKLSKQNNFFLFICRLDFSFCARRGSSTLFFKSTTTSFFDFFDMMDGADEFVGVAEAWAS